MLPPLVVAGDFIQLQTGEVMILGSPILVQPILIESAEIGTIAVIIANIDLCWVATDITDCKPLDVTDYKTTDLTEYRANGN